VWTGKVLTGKTQKKHQTKSFRPRTMKPCHIQHFAMLFHMPLTSGIYLFLGLRYLFLFIFIYFYFLAVLSKKTMGKTQKLKKKHQTKSCRPRMMKPGHILHFAMLFHMPLFSGLYLFEGLRYLFLFIFIF
jgi:hypothetical protein